MGGGDPPAAPDPVATAKAQTNLNVDSAVATQMVNQTDQVNPEGSLTYSPNGTRSYTGANGKVYNIPQYTATQTLSPALQAIYDKNLSTEGSEADIANSEVGRIGQTLASPMPTFDGSNHAVQDQLFSEYSPYQSHIQQVADEANDSKLANSGATPGSEAYNNAMRLQGTTDQDAWNSLLTSGQSQAYNELQGNFATAMTAREAPINELTALISGSQVAAPSIGTFGQTPSATIAPANYEQDVQNSFQDQMAGYNAQLQQSNAMMGGIFGVGSALAGGWAMSDRRLKAILSTMGRLANGLMTYLYRFYENGVVQVGLMADEVEAHFPDAVMAAPTGYKIINYERAVL